MKYFWIGVLVLLLQSCYGISEKRKSELWSMIKSDHPDSIISATLEIKKAKDTSMLSALLYNPYDPRITNILGVKGKSVYQIKMETLGFITGKKPPKELTYQPDSIVVNYYLNESHTLTNK